MPVFNEMESIEDTVRKLAAYRESSPLVCPVIIVDDGSTDGTSDYLQSLRVEGVEVVRHSLNRGYGAALKTGVLKSATEWVGIIDADLTYPLEAFEEFSRIQQESGADMVVGARTSAVSKVPLIRRPAKWMLGRLANYLSGRKIPDLNSGMRLIRKKFVLRFLPIIPNGFSFTTTITLAGECNNYHIEYVPINYYARGGTSKIRPIADTMNFVSLIIRTVLYFAPLRVFLPMAMLLGAAALIVLAVTWWEGRIYDATVVLLALAALNMLGIGMIADLIDKRASMK